MKSKLRIIGGKYRSRLVEWSSPQIRPTPNIMRERLFNWLQFECHDKTFLDCFSGSGILGIEAISRGAKHVTFVDIDIQACRDIEKNISTLGAMEHATVHPKKIPFNAPSNYDVILCDPPYDMDDFTRLFEWLNTSFPGATLYFESSNKTPLEFPENWHILKTAKQGLCRAHLIDINHE